jgi:co-chaperonin GroES (HSP10)
MNCINGQLVVQFDTSHNKVVGKGFNGIDIIRPDMWLYSHGDAETHTKFDENHNKLETDPQICTVIHANSKYPYKVGDRLFVHYMAYETAEKHDDGYWIDAYFVFFTIEQDGKIKPVKDLYLAEPVFEQEKVTDGGIIIQGGKKDNLRLKIVVVPENNVFDVGDTVLSIDKNNYTIKYQDKEYVKIMEHEIVGKILDKAS